MFRFPRCSAFSGVTLSSLFCFQRCSAFSGVQLSAVFRFQRCSFSGVPLATTHASAGMSFTNVSRVVSSLLFVLVCCFCSQSSLPCSRTQWQWEAPRSCNSLRPFAAWRALLSKETGSERRLMESGFVHTAPCLRTELYSTRSNEQRGSVLSSPLALSRCLRTHAAAWRRSSG